MLLLKVALISFFTIRVPAFQRTRHLKDATDSLSADILLQTGLSTSAQLDEVVSTTTPIPVVPESNVSDVSSKIESAISKQVNRTVEAVTAKVLDLTTPVPSNLSKVGPSFGDALTAAASAAAGLNTSLKVDQKANEGKSISNSTEEAKEETPLRNTTKETKSFGEVVANAAKAATAVETKVVQKAEKQTTTSLQATLGASPAVAASAATTTVSKVEETSATATEAEEKEKQTTTSWAPEVSKTFGDAAGTAAESAADKVEDDFSSVAAAAAKAVTAAAEKAANQKLTDAMKSVTAGTTSVATNEKVAGDIQDALKVVSKSWTNDTEAALRKSVEDTKTNILNASELLDRLDEASSKILDSQSHAAAAKMVKQQAEQRLAAFTNETIALSGNTLSALSGQDGISDVDKMIASSAAAQTSAKEAAELAKQADAAKRIYDQQLENGEQARREELNIAIQMSRQLESIMESSAKGLKALGEEVNATESRGIVLNISLEGSKDSFLARVLSNESVRRTAEELNQPAAVLDKIKEKASNYTQVNADNLIDQLNDVAQKTSEVVSGTVQQAQRLADIFNAPVGVDRRPLVVKPDVSSETPVLAGIAILVALLLAVICCTSMAKM